MGIFSRGAAMERHDVEYESAKHAAFKLFSQGVSPSAQKVREIRGAGSNTAIAEYLKMWREPQAAKKVCYLPVSISEELIDPSLPDAKNPQSQYCLAKKS